MDELQELQDNWTKATGIAFITVDCNGKPFTRQSGFTDFCRTLREKNEEYRELCYFCDACGGRRAKRNGKPYVYICHAGLVDFAIPISVGEQYIGAILAGQINALDKDNLKPITSKSVDWRKDPELVRMYNEVPKISLDKIQAVSNTIYESYNYVAEREYVNKIDKELKEKKLKLMKEENFGLRWKNLSKILSLKRFIIRSIRIFCLMF